MRKSPCAEYFLFPSLPLWLKKFCIEFRRYATVVYDVPRAKSGPRIVPRISEKCSRDVRGPVCYHPENPAFSPSLARAMIPSDQKYFDRETTSGLFKYEEYLVGVAESAHGNFGE